MKKIIVMSLPLLAVTLCANCGGGNSNNHTFVFSGENCTLNNQSSYKEDKQNPINLTLTTNGDDYYLSNDISVLIGSKRGVINTDYTYTLNDNKKTANLSLCVSDNIVVIATAYDVHKVSKTGFADALSFKRTYAQIKYINSYYPNDYMLYKFGLNHVSICSLDSGVEEYSYYRKSNGKYEYYDTEWSEIDETEYPILADTIGYRIKNYAYTVISTLDDLNYDETTKKYSVTKYVQGVQFSLTLSFLNGALTYISLEEIDYRAYTFDCAYAVEEPTVPD